MVAKQKRNNSQRFFFFCSDHFQCLKIKSKTKIFNNIKLMVKEKKIIFFYIINKNYALTYAIYLDLAARQKKEMFVIIF